MCLNFWPVFVKNCELKHSRSQDLTQLFSNKVCIWSNYCLLYFEITFSLNIFVQMEPSDLGLHCLQTLCIHTKKVLHIEGINLSPGVLSSLLKLCPAKPRLPLDWLVWQSSLGYLPWSCRLSPLPLCFLPSSVWPPTKGEHSLKIGSFTNHFIILKI